METMKIMNPVADQPLVTEEILNKIQSLDGVVVGLISNEWRCISIMDDHLAEVLPARYNAAETFKTPVDVVAVTPPEVLDGVAERSGASVVGIAH